MTQAKGKLIISMVIFGSMGLLVKATPLPSSVIAAARGAMGVVFLLIVCGVRGFRTKRADWKPNLPALLLSSIMLALDWIFLFEAYKRTSVSISTVTYYIAPAILVVLSAVFLGERLSRVKALCIGAALGGMVLVSGIFSGGADSGDLSGIVFGVAAAVTYAGMTFSSKLIKGIDAMESTLAQLAIATVLIIPYALLTEEVGALTVAGLDILILVTLGVVHTGLGFWLFFGSTRGLSSQTIAVFSYIDPITAILLSAVFLGERMSILQIAGTLLILGSTLVSEFYTAHRRVPEAGICPPHREGLSAQVESTRQSA